MLRTFLNLDGNITIILQILSVNALVSEIKLRVVLTLFELFALAIQLLPQILLLLGSHASSIKL